MRNELELTEQEIQDGLALARLMEDERLWGAVRRLLATLNEDAISRWDTDKDGAYSKKWLRGYREAAGAVQPAIEKRAQDALACVEAKKRDEVGGQAMMDEGRGAGDLVVA